MDQPRLVLSGVSYLSILHHISATFSGGQVVGLIGPNGAGKSTLLRIAAGVLPASEGTVTLDGVNLSTLHPRDRARRLAYLPQHLPNDIPFTVRDFVEMGRYAHRSANAGVVDAALVQMNLTTFADAPMDTLSGGERARAGIARCLAQESRVLLLDEPIASLDLYYQVDILRQLRTLAQRGYLVVIAIHHLELAIRFCDQFLLLHCGYVRRQGTVTEVMTECALEEVFGIRAKTFHDPHTGVLRLSVLV
ncbi:ABC transporter ATP-binding protein [Alicyclobacillus cycloheptanicus]|uniref:Iron complex transport system ATP-binding protein n=1 Tax=Alicyclobacillus cycloheptanicus TaxID=1457 RepID=A0ABT9XF85_9BACL|nr:ABC transporter ATP-binding protein [Alicyclobacillus cycloheptanicus]MDQ0188947.1 iron complex transport system ATP-binding protein [Alicyclobacillus cycloheptanicus]WDM01704.1 ABC transporter ATP-binding protein [Alicyclobacillus cycloheptanicus]